MEAALLASRTAGVPLCVIALTRKGCGVSFMENRLEWHYLPMTDEQYRAAIEGLDAAEREIGSDEP